MEATRGSETGTGLSDRRAPRSRILGLSVAALCALAGCTAHRLEINTVKQAHTVTDLEYRQILDNLAMFSLNPDALPSLVTLKTGASQVGDTGSAGLLGVSGLVNGELKGNVFGTFGASPTVTGTRTIVDQWGSSPQTDDNNLLLLRKAFRCALGRKDLIDEDDANDLAHDLNPQIGTTADMSVDRDTLNTIFSQNVVSSAMARFMPPDPARKNPPPGTPGFESLHGARRDELEHVAQRLADVNEIFSDIMTDTLDHEILAKTYAFRFSRRLNVGFAKDVSEIPTSGQEDIIWVAAVKGGLQLRIFDSEGKMAFDIQLIPSVRDGTELRNTGKRLIIAAYVECVPYFRIFDADGIDIFEANGTDVVNTSSGSQTRHTAPLEDLGRQLDQLPSTRDLTPSEKNRIIAAVVSLADRSVLTKIKDIQDIYERSWPPEDVVWPVKRKLIKSVVEITGLKGLLKERFEPYKYASTGLAKETIYRLNDVQKTLDEISTGWFRWGPKKPKHACYVGHACFCGRECYVWVCDDGLDELSKFTRAVLKLGATFKDVQVVTMPTGIQFSPALTNAPR
jgi:hypothetical protein